MAPDQDVVPEKAHGRRDGRHERLGFREFQSQLDFEKRGQCSFLFMGNPFRLGLLLRAGRGAHEKNEVIRVPDG
jgi:hypothetical protein